jgi:retron-type reverse transcriptase
MKRHGNLWQELITFENLYYAAMKAQQGKRYRENVLEFNYNLEENLLILRQELEQKTYQPGDYYSFRIYDPKPRLISAAPYRDRIVHHALCNIIVPRLDKSFITDCYANRKDYGTHKALRRFINFSRSSQYVLQCDIKKYFPSIDHQILKELLRRKIKCLDTLGLIDLIIDNSNEQEPALEYFAGDKPQDIQRRRRGLPIGNLTSQFFANFYLNGLDHFIKETLSCKKYLRYVDDFALFSDDREYLLSAKILIEKYLEDLRLKLHPAKSQLFATNHGVNFVGFRVFPDRVRVRNDNLRRARLRLKEMQRQYANGRITLKKLIERIQSWEAHLKHGDTKRLRKEIFDRWVFKTKSIS